MPHPKPIEWRIVKPQVDKFLTMTVPALFGNVTDHRDHPIIFTPGCPCCLHSTECKTEVIKRGLVQAVAGLHNKTLVEQAWLLADMSEKKDCTELERLHDVASRPPSSELHRGWLRALGNEYTIEGELEMLSPRIGASVRMIKSCLYRVRVRVTCDHHPSPLGVLCEQWPPTRKNCSSL